MEKINSSYKEIIQDNRAFREMLMPAKERLRHQLVTLHYLDMADGVGVSPQIIPFEGLKSGLICGTKFDRDTERKGAYQKW